MSSNLKIGLGLSAAIATIVVIVYVFASGGDRTGLTTRPSLGVNSTADPSVAQPLEGLKPNTNGMGGSELGKNAQAPIRNSVASDAAATTTFSKAQRQEQKAARVKAMQELSQVLSKGEKADPKQVMAALDRVEKTIPTPEGKQQIMLSRKVYEKGLQIQILAKEFATISTSTQPQDKARQQALLAEITNLQTQIQNAANATREYAASQLRGVR